MIFSSIYAKDVVHAYPKALRTAIEYLKSTDFSKIENGTYEIQGKEIYVSVMDAVTKPLEEGKAEAHEKYVDVQFVIEGREKLGFVNDDGSYEIEERFEDRDIMFYKPLKNEGFVEAVPGCYSIFFPADIHMPCLMVEEPEKIRKAVVKVSVDLL